MVLRIYKYVFYIDIYILNSKSLLDKSFLRNFQLPFFLDSMNYVYSRERTFTRVEGQKIWKERIILRIKL